MSPIQVAIWSQLPDRQPAYALVANVDLVVIRYDDKVSVLYGRCVHRGALLADGHIDGQNLICGVHGWDYRYDTGVSEYNEEETLNKFTAWVDAAADAVYVDEAEVAAWHNRHPQAYNRDSYLGLYQDLHGGPDEPHNKYIRQLAKDGLSKFGHHGKVSAMGVSRLELPTWDDIQILTAQLATRPRLDDYPVSTELIIGPNAQKPLRLEMPLFVSDMSFGSLSEEAKVALALGAEMAGTGICSGEGGMLPEEQAANSRYFYELASAKFGWSLDKVQKVQAFHFKGGQGAKTGTGGHLPGAKVVGKIAQVRGLPEGQSAISPAAFPDLITVADFQEVAAQVREISGGIPVGFKLSAQHIEADMDFALAVGADYIILDGRGGATGAAPELFKNNISVPTMVALARARKHLRSCGREDITLIITGGLRTESDFIKAMCLGADGVALANSALQAIGCLGMRACHTNNCPVGIATQKPNLRARLIVQESAKRLARYLEATTHLMQVMARACGHDHLNQFNLNDITTWKRDVAYLTGVSYAGVTPL
ncbi:MAG: Rieske 2Fe-2S domain-containing protein [Chloroflexi bacterium]|nr:Rieske 2Fe-2S domain-containing protein [Chloroflexota bacterium]MBP8059670.1 Rieske 2Fe-2S domain-containing protein [Chloroflexota bacterium]